MTNSLRRLSSTPSSDPVLDNLIEEYANRLQAGDPVAVEEYVRAHPERAEQLRRLLPAMQMLADLGRSAEASKQAGDTADLSNDCHLGTLGDYRIVREVGRGGMGIVYEAEQLSLRRRVALKVLPLAATLESRHLQRFQNEAQAAAHLHHCHIVPVHGVGCERGVHFYAMQFIDGQTLAAIIQELAQAQQAPLDTTLDDLDRTGDSVPASARSSALTPAPAAGLSTERSTNDSAYCRTVARLGLQAAQALEHAHQQGVIHRDIKPANLLVDGPGNLWITDFGLAHVQSDTRLTLTGDLLGTLRYMSPEQALGKNVAMDHRTDVYSLGATLYELLTLTPAIVGSDRAEILQRIAQEEPPPPARLYPAIPAELEIIVLKAMAKESQERYASAQELGDDLQRFLEDRPILARRPTLQQRVSRWTRRHKGVVFAAVVTAILVLATTVTVLIAKNVEIRAEQEQTRAEERKATKAREAAEIALEAEKKARDAEKKAKDDFALALHDEQQTAYVHRIVLAHREWLAGNLLRAAQLLNECPLELRRWDWHYLERLGRTEFLTLRGGKSKVVGLTFHPDGRRLASVSEDGNLRIWDAQTGQQVFAFHVGGRASEIRLDFSPDGSRLALALATSGAGVFKLKYAPTDVGIWDARSGKKVVSLVGHKNSVLGVAFSPDGKRLVTASKDMSLKLWNAQTGEELLSLKGHLFDVQAAAFSPDGTRLVSAGRDAILKLWDAHTGKCLLTLSGHKKPVTAVAFSPAGDRLVSGDLSGTLRVWAATTGTVDYAEVRSCQGHLGAVHSLAFSPDGRRLGSAAALDKVVKLWDPETLQELNTYRGHTDEVTGLAFSPDGQRLASASLDGTVKLWDSTVPQECRLLSHHRNTAALMGPLAKRDVTCLVFSKDSKRLASGGHDHRSVECWDVATSQEFLLPAVPHKTATSVLAFGRQDTRLAAVTLEGVVKVWDTTTGQEAVAHKPEGLGVLGLAPFSFGGIQDAEIATHWIPIALSPDGERFAARSKEGVVQIWDVVSGQKLHACRGHGPKEQVSVAFSADGKRLASAGVRDKTVRIWDAATGAERLTVTHDLHGVLNVAFSPDGSTLAFSNLEGRLQLVDADSGKEVRNLHLPARKGLSFVFSPDSQRLALTAGTEGEGLHSTVRIYEVRSGLELVTLPTKSLVNTLAFSPDGQYLAAAGREGVIWLWETGAPSLKERAIRLVSRQHVWHLIEARQGELEKRWFAAAWHLDRLAAAAPADKQLLARQAWAHALLGNWDKIGDAGLTSLEARLKWNDLESIGLGLAAARVQRGDQEDYRRLSAAMVKLYGRMKNARIAYLVARSATLGPGSGADAAEVVKVAQRAVQADPKAGWYLHTLGVAHYRAGQYEQAVQQLRASLTKDPQWDAHVLNWLVLGMAQHRLGQPDEARKWRDQALQWVEKMRSSAAAGNFPSHPHDRLVLPLLLREVETVFKEPPGPAKSNP